MICDTISLGHVPMMWDPISLGTCSHDVGPISQWGHVPMKWDPIEMCICIFLQIKYFLLISLGTCSHDVEPYLSGDMFL